MTIAIREAEADDVPVWDENTPAVRLYESAGFRRVGTKQLTLGDEIVEDAVFELER